MSRNFCAFLVHAICGTYITRPKQFKPLCASVAVDCIALVGALTCPLRVRTGYKVSETTKNSCCSKVERTVDHSIVSRLHSEVMLLYNSRGISVHAFEFS